MGATKDLAIRAASWEVHRNTAITKGTELARDARQVRETLRIATSRTKNASDLDNHNQRLGLRKTVMNFKGEYPANWDLIAHAVKSAARWKCIRCQAPHNVALGYCLMNLRANTSTPVMTNMANATKRNQVRKLVCFAMAFNAKLAKGNYVRDREPLFKEQCSQSAVLTNVLISLPCFTTLRAPRWSVVISQSTLPMRAVFTLKVNAKPFKAAFVFTEALRGFAWTNCSRLATSLAGIGDAWFLKMRIALSRAKSSLRPRFVHAEFKAASFAGLRNFHSELNLPYHLDGAK